MPKRKYSDVSYEYLRAKVKKLEREILRGRRNYESSSSSDSPPPVRRSRTKDRRHRSPAVSKRRRQIQIAVTSSDDDASGNQELWHLSAHESTEDAPPVLNESPTDEDAAPAAPGCPAAADAAAPLPAAGADPAALDAAAPPPPAPSDTPPSPAGPDVSAPPAAAEAPQAAAVAPSDPVFLPPSADMPTPSTETELDPELLDILGEDPTKASNFGKEIQKDLAVRFEHCVTSGLTKETRKELTDKYLIPSNCKLLDAPCLNPEIKAALSDPVSKKDKAIESRQKLVAAAISALGEAITILLTSNEKNSTLTRFLMDAGRILCDCQYNDSLVRRNFILSSLKKDMKDQLQNTKVDCFLFGQNFSEALKAAKAINKSGAELKAFPPAKQTTSKMPTPSTSKNWKNANLARKQTALPIPPRTTGTYSYPYATTKTPRGGSSKQSQYRRNERSRR